ncbi:MAG: sigma-70 family RNA polymerase sigma factor [Acidobacteriaceae bacterium]|nr:sigma-70 family RNA polymerase sigma factor [Acidobacteriota bacterium]MBV8812511.1 sigma-70 family RNA polymerase sigma factor [Acidobacteriaceae bacterium]MBV9498321.1 sigma-70 family RNA polymerase sigma factor [Acidobacteriaceae bacterium]
MTERLPDCHSAWQPMMTNLIESHISYAHAVAAELLGRFPAHVDRSDVVAAAEYGLVQAANAYDPSKGVAFTTFAYYRIRGAVFDLLRETVKASRFEEAANEYMVDHSAGASAGAPSYAEMKNLASGIVASYFLSLGEPSSEPPLQSAEAPLDLLLRQEQQKGIRQALQALPEKNRMVLEAYYFEDLTLEEIGKRLGLSKSWVSRMHAKGLEMLRPAVERTVSSQADRLKT